MDRKLYWSQSAMDLAMECDIEMDRLIALVEGRFDNTNRNVVNRKDVSAVLRSLRSV